MIRHFGLDRQYANLKDEILDASHQALSSGTWVGGPFTTKFEKWLAEKTKCDYAVTVHSGTQALEIIARYHYERSYTEEDHLLYVRIPNLTYVATLNSFINATGPSIKGYDIDIVDTDSNGIMLPSENYMIGGYNCYVGLYGAPTPPNLNSDDIVDGAQHWLIADGNVGTGMAISFDPTKNLPSSGNGGAIVTNDPILYEYALAYKNNGKLPAKFADLVSHVDNIFTGTNTKMSEQDCAHLLVRTAYIDEWQERRQQIRYYYLDKFKNLPIRCLSRGFAKHADQKFVIDYVNRNELHNYLISQRIDTRIHYNTTISELPVSKQYRRLDFLSASTMLSRSVLSLPIYPELSNSEVEYIAQKVINFFDK